MRGIGGNGCVEGQRVLIRHAFGKNERVPGRGKALGYGGEQPGITPVLSSTTGLTGKWPGQAGSAPPGRGKPPLLKEKLKEPEGHE